MPREDSSLLHPHKEAHIICGTSQKWINIPTTKFSCAEMHPHKNIDPDPQNTRVLRPLKPLLYLLWGEVLNFGDLWLSHPASTRIPLAQRCFFTAVDGTIPKKKKLTIKRHFSAACSPARIPKRRPRSMELQSYGSNALRT